MKNSIIVILLLYVHVFYGQTFTGKATYKTYRKTSANDSSIKDEVLQKKIQEKIKKMSQKTYTLNFSESKSTYIQNKELQTETQSGDMHISYGNGGGTDVLFKDISKKTYTKNTEISGKIFLVKDSLRLLKWNMTSETKKIGSYTCYKATKSREEEHKSFMITDGEKVENKKKVTVITTAWYTLEIPISNGPKNHWGLPGLILEVQQGKETIICSELVLNPTKKTVIEEPKKGKKVTQKEFDSTLKKKVDEMIERYKNNRKIKKGESMSIEIQG